MPRDTATRAHVSLYVEGPTRRRLEAYRARLASQFGVPISTSAAIVKLLALALDAQGVADPGPAGDELAP